MQDLIEKLKTTVGISDEQANKAISTIKDYVSEKFPMLEGAVGSLFGSHATSESKPQADNTAKASASTTESIQDKASDMMNEAKEKLGSFAHTAEDKLEDLSDSAQDMAKDAINKLKGLFGK